MFCALEVERMRAVLVFLWQREWPERAVLEAEEPLRTWTEPGRRKVKVVGRACWPFQWDARWKTHGGFFRGGR